MIIEIHKNELTIKEKKGVSYFLLYPLNTNKSHHTIWDNGLFDTEVLSKLNISYQVPNVLKNTVYLNIIRPVVAFLIQLQELVLLKGASEVIFKGHFLIGSPGEINFLEYQNISSLDYFLKVLFKITDTLEWGVKFSYENKGIRIYAPELRKYSIMHCFRELASYTKLKIDDRYAKGKYLYIDGLFEMDSLRHRVAHSYILTRNPTVVNLAEGSPVIQLTGGLNMKQKGQMLKKVINNIFFKSAVISINNVSLRVSAQSNKLLLLQYIITEHLRNLNIKGQIYTNKTFGHDLSIVFEAALDNNLKLINIQQASIEHEKLPNFLLAHHYQFMDPYNFLYYRSRMKSIELLPINVANNKTRIPNDTINVVFYLQPEKFHILWKEFFEFNKLPSHTKIKYWVRPHYRSDEEIISQILRRHPELYLHRFKDPLFSCDVAVGYDSSVLYHAAALGIPSLIIPSNLKSVAEKSKYISSISDEFSENSIAKLASDYSTYSNNWLIRHEEIRQSFSNKLEFRV